MEGTGRPPFEKVSSRWLEVLIRGVYLSPRYTEPVSTQASKHPLTCTVRTYNGGRTADPIRSHPPRPLWRPNHKTTARSTVSALAALEHDTAIGMPDADPFAPNAEDFADFADFGSPPVFEANLDAVPNSGPPYPNVRSQL